MFNLRKIFRRSKIKKVKLVTPYDRDECRHCENLVDCIPVERQCFDNLIPMRDADGKIISPTKAQRMFYGLHLMPCCGGDEFFEGPSGGMSTNIRCGACNQKWNICPPLQLIERI